PVAAAASPTACLDALIRRADKRSASAASSRRQSGPFAQPCETPPSTGSGQASIPQGERHLAAPVRAEVSKHEQRDAQSGRLLWDAAKAITVNSTSPNGCPMFNAG